MTTAAEPAIADRTSRADLMRIIQIIGPLIGLIAIIILFSALRPATFATYANAQIILKQTAIVGVAALGMTLIIISGGIDLSVGSVIALSCVTVALLLTKGCHPVVAACGGIIAGCAAGLLTGLLITGLRVLPFVVTLGGLRAIRGLAQYLGNDQTVDAPATWLNGLQSLPSAANRWMIFPIGVWITIVLAIVVAIAMRYTKLGRHFFAIGSNEQTARLCGINVNWTKIAVYSIGGLFAGIAGVLQFSELTVGDTTTAMGLELDIIAAVVLGGASLSGGQGTILGTIIGALIMKTVDNGCTKLNLSNSVQMMVTGSIIVIAVAIDRFQHARSSRGS